VTKEKKAIEWVKTVFIMLLSASALILAWRTGLFSGLLNDIPFFGNVAGFVRNVSGPTEASGVVLKEAARPLSIVITNEDGSRFGAKYDTDMRNAVYDRTSSILGEALGSASTPVIISEGEWREALSGPGVFFEYFNPVKLSVLDGWLGARIPDNAEDVSLRHVFIAFGEDKSRIYYQDSERGLFFSADTASASGKIQELEIYSGNGAMFAFETGVSNVESAPYMLVMQDRYHPEVNAATAGSTGELLDIVIAAMGHSEEKYTTYNDSKGLLVCVGTQFNINIDPGGRVFYRRTDNIPPDDTKQLQDMNVTIERARAIVADTLGRTCGGAEVFFDSIEYSADGSCTVFFGYYIAGGRVFLHEDNNAARIRFTSMMPPEIELTFKNFSLTNEFSKLYPERQVLAAAGGEFLLSYSDTGPETLKPFWVRTVNNEQRTTNN